MPLVNDPEETRRHLELLRRCRMAMPCFCTENDWTTEAILEATAAVGQRLGLRAPPVSIAFTAGYPGRSNLENYWTCGNQRLAYEALLGSLEALLSPSGPYGSCRVFLHLDHGQPDADRWLLEDCVDRFAMVMFDASALPLEENMARTADYVRRFGERVVVEGAVDELKEAGQAEQFALTSPEQAERFVEETGCDLIVPNVGTEHRAARAGQARYHDELARQIARAVGPRLVLHGTSCMGEADLSGLPGDGFVKVNVWTIIEKTGGRQVAEYAIGNAARLLEAERLEELRASGVLGPGPEQAEEVGPHIDYFPLANLRRRWVAAVARMLERYFDMFGYARLAGQEGC